MYYENCHLGIKTAISKIQEMFVSGFRVNHSPIFGASKDSHFVFEGVGRQPL
jgi:hypothetical protein